MDITAASIATLISSCIAAGLTLYFNRRNEIRTLNDQLDNIIKIAIQHPYLENSAFLRTWKDNRHSEEEKYLRYDLYCTLLFNFLERFCLYFKCHEGRIQRRLAVKEWVRLHKDYWLYPQDNFENVDGYREEFRDLVKGYLGQ
jgi:hypothetical protein